MSKFLAQQRGDKNVYRFTCVACGVQREVELPDGEHGPFACPAGCGASYVQWVPARTPVLQCFVRPGFDRDDDSH